MKKIILILFLTFLISTLIAQEPPKAKDWNWVKYEANPVMVPSASIDDTYLYYLSVMLMDGKYRMWYRYDDSNYQSSFGYAQSDDGISWSKNPRSILIPGGDGACPHETYIMAPHVFFKDNKFHMYYTGLDGASSASIGYAYSDDGIIWTKYAQNPILSCGESSCWDSRAVGVARVLFENDQYKMWYGGTSITAYHEIGYAASTDGITWLKQPEPILEFEGTQFWDAYVLKSDEGYYYMWYTEGPWGNDRLDIRYAYSLDGLDWIVEENNIAIPRGEAGQWDSKYMGTPAVIYDENDKKYKMWYFGSDENGNYRFGYAYSDNPTDINESDITPNVFFLDQNYPNPFNPNTTIKYGVNVETVIHLNVFDVLGREVATLISEIQKPGNYEIEYDGGELTSGIYFYKLQAGDFVETKKMILLK